jgi:hypothetical protein
MRKAANMTSLGQSRENDQDMAAVMGSQDALLRQAASSQQADDGKQPGGGGGRGAKRGFVLCSMAWLVAGSLAILQAAHGTQDNNPMSAFCLLPPFTADISTSTTLTGVLVAVAVFDLLVQAVTFAGQALVRWRSRSHDVLSVLDRSRLGQVKRAARSVSAALLCHMACLLPVSACGVVVSLQQLRWQAAVNSAPDPAWPQSQSGGSGYAATAPPFVPWVSADALITLEMFVWPLACCLSPLLHVLHAELNRRNRRTQALCLHKMASRMRAARR